MKLPIEINYGAISKSQIWKVASEIEGLQVIQGIGIHDLKAFEELGKSNKYISKIK